MKIKSVSIILGGSLVLGIVGYLSTKNIWFGIGSFLMLTILCFLWIFIDKGALKTEEKKTVEKKTNI